MVAVFSLLARHRWISVATAILVEVVILVPLALADPESVLGLPGAVVAGIGGTVAVALGLFDGVLVALVGAVVFAALGGWEGGELAALVVWPTVVAAAGLFARRVEQQRRALGQVVAAQEAERQRLALELHDGTAQMLAASLLGLGDGRRDGEGSPTGAAGGETREIIRETIESVRALAVELRPKALDDFGLAPALESLARSFTGRTGVAVELTLEIGATRLPPEVELAVYRLVQEVLKHVEEIGHDRRVRVSIERRGAVLQVVIEQDGSDRRNGSRSGWTSELDGMRERLRLVGGRLSARSTALSTAVRAELPLERA